MESVKPVKVPSRKQRDIEPVLAPRLAYLASKVDSPTSLIKNFVIDCDGCLTDGKFTYTAEGKVSKVYGPDDSDALDILKRHMNIYFVSGDKRGFEITKKRVEDMKFTVELVSTFNRLAWIKQKMDPAETIFMGDGIYDALVFPGVAYSIAPANGFYLTKQKANFVTASKGGEGAVTEACVHIIDKFFGGFDLSNLDFSKGSGSWEGEAK